MLDAVRIGRQRNGEFVASTGDGRWYALSALGIVATDTRAAAGRREAIERALRDADGGGAVADPDLVSPVVRPGKVLAIGLNYLDHIKETGCGAARAAHRLREVPVQHHGALRSHRGGPAADRAG